MTVFPSFPYNRGTTIIEIVVACTVLGSLMLFIGPATVRHGRLQRLLRQERIAMDEISNQLDRLTRLRLDQIQQELAKLAPSEFARTGLPNPRLSGTLQGSEEGYRLALEISWNTPGRYVVPLTIATWVYPSLIAETPEEERAR
jgi:type II secretory pathway pseudopilin PulG